LFFCFSLLIFGKKIRRPIKSPLFFRLLKIELSHAKRYHTDCHNDYRDNGESFKFALQSFALILFIGKKGFLLTVERADTIRIARLKHYYDNNENRAKNG